MLVHAASARIVRSAVSPTIVGAERLMTSPGDGRSRAEHEMKTDLSSIDIEEQDRVRIVLAHLLRANPEWAHRASARILERVKTRMVSEIEDKRAHVLQELALLEQARTIVLGESPPPSVNGTWASTVLQGFVNSLRAYQENERDLARVSALDAYLTHYVDCCHEQERANHEPLTPASELRERRRERMDSERVQNATHRPAFQLSREMLRFMAEEADKIRTREDWWEVAVLVLCIEDHEVTTDELGLDVELPLGGWNSPGDDIFGHREGMRLYVDRGPKDHRKADNDLIFWTLARRASMNLAATLPEVLEVQVPPTPSASTLPFSRLRGWTEICDALGAPRGKNSQKRIRQMNELEGGPIIWVRHRPEANKIELLAWWSDIEGRARRAEECRESSEAARDELQERGGIRQQDYSMHSEKRPNAKGKAGPAPPSVD